VKNIQRFRTHYLNDKTESDVANEDRSSGISSFLTINKRRIVSYGIVKKSAELRWLYSSLPTLTALKIELGFDGTLNQPDNR
jgi:hypothetical protein